jgi:histidine ammonia-lyase
VAAARDALRESVPPLAEDRPQTPDIEAISEMVRGGSLVARVEKAVGPLEPAYAI